MTSNNEKIINKIRALLAMTVDNGCSENEALIAAEHARRIMLEYNFSMSDIEIKESKCVGKTKTYMRKQIHDTFNLIGIIAKFTNTKGFIVRINNCINVCFFGMEHDVIFSHYLLDIFYNCSEFEWNKWKEEHKNSIIHGKKLRTSFMLGFVNRINDRINNMIFKNESHCENGKTGSALIILKNQIVDSAWAAENISLRGGKSREVTVISSIYSDGQQAANKVHINRGLDSETTQKIA
jgi:hypothetical protein